MRAGGRGHLVRGHLTRGYLARGYLARVWTGLSIVSLGVASAGCATLHEGGPPVRTPVAVEIAEARSRELVQEFLVAVQRHDGAAMARSFGRRDGRGGDRDPEQWQARLEVIRGLLVHDDARIAAVRRSLVGGPQSWRVGVDLATPRGWKRDVGFHVVRGVDGAWRIERVELERITRRRDAPRRALRERPRWTQDA